MPSHTGGDIPTDDSGKHPKEGDALGTQGKGPSKFFDVIRSIKNSLTNSLTSRSLRGDIITSDVSSGDKPGDFDVIRSAKNSLTSRSLRGDAITDSGTPEVSRFTKSSRRRDTIRQMISENKNRETYDIPTRQDLQAVRSRLSPEGKMVVDVLMRWPKPIDGLLSLNQVDDQKAEAQVKPNPADAKAPIETYKISRADRYQIDIVQDKAYRRQQRDSGRKKGTETEPIEKLPWE